MHIDAVTGGGRLLGLFLVRQFRVLNRSELDPLPYFRSKVALIYVRQEFDAL